MGGSGTEGAKEKAEGKSSERRMADADAGRAGGAEEERMAQGEPEPA